MIENDEVRPSGPTDPRSPPPHPRVTQVRVQEKTFSRMMTGYIGLSRVKQADDLYLPQAFSPALFRQGPQPWPTLLMQYLKGEQDESRLEEMAEKAAQKSSAERQKTNNVERLRVGMWKVR